MGPLGRRVLRFDGRFASEGCGIAIGAALRLGFRGLWKGFLGFLGFLSWTGPLGPRVVVGALLGASTMLPPTGGIYTHRPKGDTLTLSR